ncbi:hypothetical protein FACUT_1569 [Fusarium acutatum]|uniref:Uncharacterized protein n=1 Tax=Fusarium acutatum TaxID=78861 RepID=A0A8H4K1L9_9HYPO|nr:hypothetical protein FACUT_1569 [Fusarium acutatum]
MPHSFEINGKSPLLVLPEHLLISFLNKASFDTADIEEIQEEVLGTHPLFLSEPRNESEVLKSVLRKGQFPFTLKGYFKFGFQPSSQWISTQSRDPNRGEQSVIAGFAGLYKSKEDTKDGLNIFKLFLRQTLQTVGASTSDSIPRPSIDHLVEWIKWTADALFADEFRDGICDMIEMLCKSGGVIDLYQDRFGAQGYPETVPDNAVELAMQSYCPISLLENFLMYCPVNEGPLTARSKHWRRLGSDLPRGTHHAVSKMDEESENEGLFRLFSAVSCLASDSYKTECEKLTVEFGPRRHQFIINDRFGPRVEWMKYTAYLKIPELHSGPGKKFRDKALEIWRRLIIERGDNRRWWEITEQDKWFVPIEEVKSALRVANPSAADARGLPVADAGCFTFGSLEFIEV